MALDIQGLVGLPSTPYGDTDRRQLRVGRMGDLIQSQFRGKYGEANSRGMVYHYTTGAVNQGTGVTIPIFTNTAQTFGIRNPPGSGVVLELIRLDIGYISGNDAPGSLVLTVPPVNQGITATLSTGVTAATLTNAQSGQLAGAINAPVSKCKIMTVITTVAPTAVIRSLGYSSETATAASTNAGLFHSWYFEGTDLIYPGADVFLASTVAAQLGVCIINITGVEIPTPPGG